MNYMDFDPYVIRERRVQMQREIDSLRLQERLWEEGGSSGSRFARFAALAKRCVRPLPREVPRAG